MSELATRELRRGKCWTRAYVIVFDQDEAGSNVLAAGEILRKAADTDLHFVQRDLRHPLAIYNISISRIVIRAQRLTDSLYDFFSKVTALNDPGTAAAVDSIEERLELFVYALAAHIDDCEIAIEIILVVVADDEALLARRLSLRARRSLAGDLAPRGRRLAGGLRLGRL